MIKLRHFFIYDDMTSLIEAQILEAEEKLRLAMLNSDVDALNKLLAPNLIFTNHLGQVLGKQDDLDAHQSGIFSIDTLIYENLQIQAMDNIAIAIVKVHLVGSFADASFDNFLRFTRVWHLSVKGNYQVIAAHSSLVSNN